VSPLKIKIPSKKSRQAALRGGFNSGVKGLKIKIQQKISAEGDLIPSLKG
jgi:hypothetical protein